MTSVPERPFGRNASTPAPRQPCVCACVCTLQLSSTLFYISYLYIYDLPPPYQTLGTYQPAYQGSKVLGTHARLHSALEHPISTHTTSSRLGIPYNNCVEHRVDNHRPADRIWEHSSRDVLATGQTT